MTKRNVRLRLVLEVEETFEESEPPSLTAIPVEAEEVPEPSRPPLARTAGDFFPWAKAAGGSK